MRLSSDSDKVRNYVKTHYVLPAQRRGERVFSVTAGEIHRNLRMRNQVPVVCTALRSQRFLEENHLALRKVTGPPSGMSTTVQFTFEIQPGSAPTAENPLIQLFGAAKELYAELGGGENFIRKEREAFERSAESREKDIGESGP